MARHNKTGDKGEELALEYLEERGYTVLETNWHYRRLEIDIIAINETFLIIVEVKTRSNDKYGLPEESVKREKQIQLIKAAQHYTTRFRIQQEVRFDIISVILSPEQPKIEHIENAFTPGWY